MRQEKADIMSAAGKFKKSKKAMIADNSVMVSNLVETILLTIKEAKVVQFTRSSLVFEDYHCTSQILHLILKKAPLFQNIHWLFGQTS